jgi:hypothetical protein
VEEEPEEPAVGGDRYMGPIVTATAKSQHKNKMEGKIMSQLCSYKKGILHYSFHFLVFFVIAFMFTGCSKDPAKDIKQKTFTSPEEAVTAFVDAAQSNDSDALLAVLGSGGKGLIDSGDPVADNTSRELFVQAFHKKHKLEYENPDTALLSTGDKEWPFPIPIIKKGETWSFDTEAGKEELLNRRIGRNELNVMEVMSAYIDAQHEYVSTDRDGDRVLEFAQKVASKKGKKDGLYWEVAEGEKMSPFGPLVAHAAAKGYTGKMGSKEPVPYHGYFFRILKGQGTHAPGGDYNYMVDDNMTLGFAMIAYPAQYGNSGIMTFKVNQNGTIYEKDIGEDTAKIVEKIEVFNPDDTWYEVD